MPQSVRALRGATTVEADDPALIRDALRSVFDEMLSRNNVANDDLISVLVTTTPDIVSIFPAKALREECGLDDVPLLGAVEADIVGATPLALRIMLHCTTSLARSEVEHVFQGQAANMRPDLNQS